MAFQDLKEFYVGDCQYLKRSKVSVSQQLQNSEVLPSSNVIPTLKMSSRFGRKKLNN